MLGKDALVRQVEGESDLSLRAKTLLRRSAPLYYAHQKVERYLKPPGVG